MMVGFIHLFFCVFISSLIYLFFVYVCLFIDLKNLSVFIQLII